MSFALIPSKQMDTMFPDSFTLSLRISIMSLSSQRNMVWDHDNNQNFCEISLYLEYAMLLQAQCFTYPYAQTEVNGWQLL